MYLSPTVTTIPPISDGST